MKALVLGASGGFGAAITKELLSQGYEVGAVARQSTEITRLVGEHKSLSLHEDVDVLDFQSLHQKCKGVDVIVFAINVPYAHWYPFMLNALSATVSALEEISKKPLLVFPGNVYALGRQEGPPFGEEAVNKPFTRKGALRAKMEEELRTASENGQPVLILRCADFFGPTVRNELVNRIFANALANKPIELLGPSRWPHQLAYTPDVAKACVKLITKSTNEPFEVYNFPGYSVASLEDFAHRVARLAGHPDLKVKKIPWVFFTLMGWFSPQMRELKELRYLFEEGVMLDGTKLQDTLKDFEPTPLDEAVEITLDSYRSAQKSKN